MIKKYGIALFAMLIGVAAVAFTIPRKGLQAQTTYNFHYNSSNFSKTEVQKNLNWQPGIGTSCQVSKSKACQMSVSSAYTHDDGTGTQVLNDAASGGSILTIAAAVGPDGVSYQPQVSTAIPSETPKP